MCSPEGIQQPEGRVQTLQMPCVSAAMIFMGLTNVELDLELTSVSGADLATLQSRLTAGLSQAEDKLAGLPEYLVTRLKEHTIPMCTHLLMMVTTAMQVPGGCLAVLHIDSEEQVQKILDDGIVNA